MSQFSWVPFQSKGVPDTDEAWVGRHAVLVPLTGPIVSLEEVEQRTQSLNARWRQWVRAVLDDGCPGLSFFAIEWMLTSCKPAFFDPDPVRWSCICARREICPHCWAREAQETWRKIDLALFRDGKPPAERDHGTQAQPRARSRSQMHVMQPRGLHFDCEFDRPNSPPLPERDRDCGIDQQSPSSRLGQYDLIERIVSYRVRRGDTDGHAGLAEHLQARHLSRRYKPGIIVGLKRELHLFQELGVVGGLDVIQIDLPRPPRGATRDGVATAAVLMQAREWDFRTHQLLLVPRGKSEALLAHPSIAGSKGAMRCQVRRCQSPSRRRIMLAVARACRYPRTLLDCPPLAMEVLQVRGNSSWSTTFGEFIN